MRPAPAAKPGAVETNTKTEIVLPPLARPPVARSDRRPACQPQCGLQPVFSDAADERRRGPVLQRTPPADGRRQRRPSPTTCPIRRASYKSPLDASVPARSQGRRCPSANSPRPEAEEPPTEPVTSLPKWLTPTAPLPKPTGQQLTLLPRALPPGPASEAVASKKPAIEALFYEYLRVAGDDKATAGILTLADVLAPAANTEIVPVPALDGRLLTVEQAGKRLKLSSRLVYKKCLIGELRPIKIDRTIYIPLTEIERYKARR